MKIDGKSITEEKKVKIKLITMSYIHNKRYTTTLIEGRVPDVSNISTVTPMGTTSEHCKHCTQGVIKTKCSCNNGFRPRSEMYSYQKQCVCINRVSTANCSLCGGNGFTVKTDSRTINDPCGDCIQGFKQKTCNYCKGNGVILYTSFDVIERTPQSKTICLEGESTYYNLNRGFKFNFKDHFKEKKQSEIKEESLHKIAEGLVDKIDRNSCSEPLFDCQEATLLVFKYRENNRDFVGYHDSGYTWYNSKSNDYLKLESPNKDTLAHNFSFEKLDYNPDVNRKSLKSFATVVANTLYDKSYFKTKFYLKNIKQHFNEGEHYFNDGAEGWLAFIAPCIFWYFAISCPLLKLSTGFMGIFYWLISSLIFFIIWRKDYLYANMKHWSTQLLFLLGNFAIAWAISRLLLIQGLSPNYLYYYIIFIMPFSLKLLTYDVNSANTYEYLDEVVKKNKKQFKILHEKEWSKSQKEQQNNLDSELKLELDHFHNLGNL